MAWDIQDGYRFPWWDSTIVAAAILANCKRLLSEDLQHEQIINHRLQIINPFAPTIMVVATTLEDERNLRVEGSGARLS
jgi:hypothetical protein